MAIIYTYPNLPLSSLSADDLLVITDIDNTNNNPTKSVKLSDIATYITNTGTGSGTTNTLTLWSDGPNGVLGDSILTQNVGATALTVTGNFIATGTGNFTSQVTIPATPGINTDAASKGYVDTQVAGIPAGLVFKGNWDASSTPGGSPDLTSAIYKVVGNYYVVSTAGAATPNGVGELPNSWDVGDWCVYIEQGGTDRWEKLDQTFIAGSGATGQAAFFTTVNSVGGDNNFFWDNTNKRLGIGTTGPETLTHIKVAGGSAQLTLERTGGGAGKAVLAGAAEGLIVYNDGFSPKMYVGTSGSYEGSVGIGTITPSAKLDVNAGGGNLIANFESTDSISEIRIKDNTAYSRILNVGAQLKLMPNDGVDLFYLDGNIKTINISPIATAASSGSAILYFKNVDDNSVTRNGASIRTVDSNNNPSGADMRFQTASDNGTLFDVFTINSNGFVGIGTTAPDFLLDVSGNARLNSTSSTTLNIQAKNPTAFNDPTLNFITWNEASGSSSGKIQLTNGTFNSNDMAFFTETSNSVTEKMRITSAGNVGIGTGTTSPESKLTVKGNPGNTNQPVRITNVSTDAKTGLFINGTGNAVGEKYGMQFGGYNEYSIGGIFGVLDSTGGSTSGDITFDFGNGTAAGDLIEKVRFTHEGNVGIGTTNPGSKLQVNGTFANTGIAQIGSTGANVFLTSPSGGSVGIGTSSPGYKLDVSGSFRATSESTFTSNLLFPDAARIKLGTLQDLQIYHNGSNGYIQDSGTGELRMLASTLSVRNSGDTELMITAIENGAVNLYHDNTKKFETTSTGVTITGDVDLGDNNRVRLGNSQDLQIYHNNVANNSIISDNSSNGLEIYATTDVRIASGVLGETYAQFTKDGPIELYYDNNKKFETTSSGVKIPTAGDGITLVSPDGNTTRTISIDNSGNLVVNP